MIIVNFTWFGQTKEHTIVSNIHFFTSIIISQEKINVLVLNAKATSTHREQCALVNTL